METDEERKARLEKMVATERLRSAMEKMVATERLRLAMEREEERRARLEHLSNNPIYIPNNLYLMLIVAF